MRWLISGIVVLALVVGLGTVGVLAHIRGNSSPGTSVAAKPSTCSDAYKALALRPSQVSAAQSACVVESLTFSGEVGGSVGEAYPVGANDAGPTSMCAVPKRWNSFPEALLAMVIGTKAYRLRISTPGKSQHQWLTLNKLANVVELAAIGDPKSDWNQVTGTVNVNPDGVTGTIDAELLRDASNAQPVHVSGKWACGAPISSASDPNVPCSNFFVLNQLFDADVARMKAHSCLAESLTFTGDVAGGVDHAVNDSSFMRDDVITKDNLCSQAYGNYVATVKFSIGDETFQLRLTASGDGSVTPGKYPARMPNLFPRILLFLGAADSTQHGVFMPDQEIEWDAIGGSFTIARDMKSGTIDADLAGPPLQSFSSVHVSGGWRCAT